MEKATQPDEHWVVDLPTPITVDISLADSAWPLSIEGRAVELLWPCVDAADGLVAPPPTSPLAEKEGETWGEVVSGSLLQIDRVGVAVRTKDSLLNRERFLLKLSEVRRRWMQWVGVFTGQTTSVRWAHLDDRLARRGVFYIHSDSDGSARLVATEMSTIRLRHPGNLVEAVALSWSRQEQAWTRVAEGQDPAFEHWTLHSARESFQFREHRTAVLELAAAFEVALAADLEALTEGASHELTLGKLVTNLAQRGAIAQEHLPAIWEFVDLRNDLIHRAAKEFYHGPCVDGFHTVLAYFRRNHPDLYSYSENDLL